MNIETIKRYLAIADPFLPVYFDFCNCAPTTVASWRGSYSEPAIGWCVTGRNGNEQAPTVKELLDELTLATHGKIYVGWKGGNYTYTDKDTLHVDNQGEYTETEIVSVEVGSSRVTLHTRQQESE